MQENKNKIIIIGAIVMVLLAVFAYVLLSKDNTATPTNNTNTTQNKPLFPDFSFNNIFSNDTNVDNNASSTENTNNTGAGVDKMIKVWGGRALGAKILDDGNIVFLDKDSGEVRESVDPYTSSNVVANIPAGCFDAKFANTGDRALVLCSDGLRLWGDSRFSFVDKNAFDYEFISGSDDFVYLSNTEKGFVLYQNRAGKTVSLGDMSLHDVSLLEANSEYVYISEKPNGRSQKVFVYSFKNKDFYFTGDLALQNIGQFQKGYVKEKCAHYDNSLNFCFGQNFSSFDFVSWRKGLISSSDQAFAYSFADSNYIGVGSLSENIDSIKVGTNASSSKMYSINKNTFNLFISDTKQFVEATNE